MKKIILAFSLLFSMLATNLVAQEVQQDSTPVRPKQEVRTLNSIPITVLYKVTTKTGKLVDIDNITFPTMALYQKDANTQMKLLKEDFEIALYRNKRMPKGYDTKRKLIRILDIKRM